MPVHRHEVELNIYRVELSMKYTFEADWDLWVRVPYEIRDQKASVAVPAGATAAQRAAMIANAELHHRDASYEGIADIQALVAHPLRSLLFEDDALVAALGTSLPVGAIEPDVLERADAGRTHLHHQFGTGTFDPLIEVYYGNPLSEFFTLDLFSTAKLPLYENRQDYRAPRQITAGGGLSWKMSESWSVRVGFLALQQGYGHWDGRRDINQGLKSQAWQFGVRWKLSEQTEIHLTIRNTFDQEALKSGADTFDQGPTVILGIKRTF